jgi:hypothetical protein
MSWTCTNGCLTDGKPTKHANQAACPVVREERRRARSAIAPERRAPPEDPAPPASAEPGSALPVPERSAGERVVSFVRESARTVSAPAVPTVQEAYLLEGEDVVGFWQIILSIGEMLINLLLTFLEVKKLPEEICDLKKSKATQLLISRNMRHTTSQLFISLGVKTKGEAQAIIGEGEGIVSFGGIFLAIGYHLVTEIPKSPVIDRWKKEGIFGPPGPVAPGAPGGTAPRPWWDPWGLTTPAPPAAPPKISVPGA